MRVWGEKERETFPGPMQEMETKTHNEIGICGLPFSELGNTGHEKSSN
jgi:hypothetical protein